MGMVEIFVKKPLRFLVESFEKYVWEPFVYLQVAFVVLILAGVLAFVRLGVYLDKKSEFFVDWLYDEVEA
jgi:hypothetical protein